MDAMARRPRMRMSSAMAASPKAGMVAPAQLRGFAGVDAGLPAYHAAKVNKIYVLMARFDVL